MGTFKTCSCGHSYSAAEWAGLPLVGIQRTSSRRESYELELKNCERCRSTMGITRDVEVRP